MESNSEASCISDPNFAVICAFLERFASSCGITYPPFVDLQEMLENMEQVPQELVDLHIILLRKARRSVFREKWEKALVKFCHSYSTQDGWEIERFGYKNSRLEVKLRVLKTLLEGQFDLNCKFKTTINTLESTELRSKPLGKDKYGKIYWLQIDPTSNIRVYREDPDEESWALVAKDRDSLVQLLQELTSDEEPLDVNLLNEDSSVSVDMEKTILDTGQEICNGENNGFVNNGDMPVEEKDPLEIKDGDNAESEAKTEELQSDIVTGDGKRMKGEAEEEVDLKKVKLDEEVNGDGVGEAIEDPVMHVYGEGNGAECDAGNPDKEDNKQDESSSSNAAEQSEPVSSGQTNSEVKKVEIEIKPQPKLWSIDTICGTANLNHSGESSKNAKNLQKNFSSFSIESVLEKKTDGGRSSSPAVESSIISVNTIAVNNSEGTPDVTNAKDVSDENVSLDNVNESAVCNANTEEIPVLDEGKGDPTKSVNEMDAVPIADKLEKDEDSTVCAEKAEERLTETKTDEVSTGGDPEVTGETQLDKANDNDIDEKLDSATPNIESEEVTNEIRKETNTESSTICAENVEGETKNVEEETKEVEEEMKKVEEVTKKVSDIEASDVIRTESEVEERTSEVNKSDALDTAPENTESVAKDGCGNEMTDLPKDETKEMVVDEKNEEGIEIESKKEDISPVEMEVEKPTEEVEAEPSKSSADVIMDNEKEKIDDVMEVDEVNVSAQKPEPMEVVEEKEPTAEESTMEVAETVAEQTEDKNKPEEVTVSVDKDNVEKPDKDLETTSATETPIECSVEPVSKTEELIEEERTEIPAVEETVKQEEPTESVVNKDQKEIEESDDKVDEDTQSVPVEVTVKKEQEEDSKEPELTPEPTRQSEPDNTVVEAVTAKEEVMTDDTLPDNEIKEVPPVVPADKVEPIDEPMEVTDTVCKEEDVPKAKEPLKEETIQLSCDEITKKEDTLEGEQVLDIPPPEAPPKEAEEGVVSMEIPPEKATSNEAAPVDALVEEKKEDAVVNELVVVLVEEKKEDEVVNDTVDAAKGDQIEIPEETKKIETRRRSRSRNQSMEESEVAQIPARTTRSGKKSVDEDTEGVRETVAKATRKRKSQDKSDEPAAEDAPVVEDTPATVEDAQPAEEPTEDDAQKLEERRNSAVNSVSDETSVAPQEERTKVSRRRKKRGKKSRVRKSVEEKRNKQGQSSDDEKKPTEEGEGAANEEETKKKSPKKPKDSTPRSRQLIPERELKLLGISNMEELPTVRQSRRIAQLKMKEEAERNRIKKLEEEAAKEEEEAKKKKKKKKASKSGTKKRKGVPTGDESYEEEDEDDEDDEEAKAKKEKKRKKKKDKLVFNELNPWISSTESSTADEEEDEIEDEPHEDEEILFKSDHEFSPESDIEDPDYKPIKRARTAKVDPKEATESDSKYDDTACEKCGEKDHPEWILLCDKCDKGWHASCVRPALMVVPEGDWFCPPCEHTSLVQKLRESLVEYDRCQKQRENEELRKKRLAFVGISLDNVLPAKKDKKPKPIEQNEGESDETASENASDDSSSSGSSDSDSSSSEESDEPVYQLRERRSNITSYRYNEYDELIKSALQEEMEAVKGVGLGKGKDITNQAGEYDEDEKESNEEEAGEEGLGEMQNVGESVIAQPTEQSINPHIPKDIMQAKPRIKPKKDDDQDYEADTDAEEDDEEYNQENDEEDEEEEELVDELPPVVPQYDKKKKKSRSLNVRSLDFTSDEEEEDNSDSDFKGESEEEESEYSLPSESESSDGVRRHKKNYDGPVRRSTRARTARYDKEFINDDSEDESPRRKRSRNVWIDSESTDSDRSWGKRKKRGGRSGNRSTVPKKKTKSKGSKKKKSSKKRNADSDNDYGQKLSKKVKNPKIKYGGLDDVDEEQVLTRRTRGKKINYQEMNASDSDDEVVKKKARMINESDEEFVAEKEKSDESEDDEMDSKREANGKAVSKQLIMQKMKKKKRKVIPDPDDFSDDDLLEDEELDEFAEELADLDEEEGSILGEMLRDGNVPIHELKEALRKLKERRKERTDETQPYPPIPDHMENPGAGPRFPKIAKMTPNRPEIPVQMGIAPETVVASMRANPGVLLGNPPKEGLPLNIPDNIPPDQAGMLLLNEQKDSKDALVSLQPPPYPFPPEAPPGVPPTIVGPHHQFPGNIRPPIPPFNSFQGIISQPPRLPPEYPHTNIPTTVLGIEADALRNQGRKPPVKAKRKNEEGLSPQGESGEENSGDGRLGESLDASPKRRGRGRGKKQLLAEAQAKQELGISTVQAPTQFPAQGLPPEGGSVITRMLNTPQGPQPFADFSSIRGRPPTSFRPPYPNALRPPLNPPSPSRLRAPAPGIFHASHPLDPSSSAINLPQTKPSPLPPGFSARPPVLPRYPSDPTLRPPFPSQSSPSRSETYPYPNFYGPYPPTVPNSEDAPFHNPNFPNHPFDEHHPPPHVDGSGGPSKVSYDEGGEFGGLASYFASQREDDLDT